MSLGLQRGDTGGVVGRQQVQQELGSTDWVHRNIGGGTGCCRDAGLRSLTWEGISAEFDYSALAHL